MYYSRDEIDLPYHILEIFRALNKESVDQTTMNDFGRCIKWLQLRTKHVYVINRECILDVAHQICVAL
jgi:hypothetical protein